MPAVTEAGRAPPSPLSALGPKLMPRLSPLSLRLTRDERARLKREAGDSPLGAHIKRRLFADEPPPAGRRPLPVRDQRTIATMLAQLGRSELAASLRDLADAARSGSLHCDDEITAILTSGCADIEFIRSMLVTALGLKPKPAPAPPLTKPRRAFFSAANGRIG